MHCGSVMDSFLVFLSISKIVLAHGEDNNGDNESDSLSESRSIEKTEVSDSISLNGVLKM